LGTEFCNSWAAWRHSPISIRHLLQGGEIRIAAAKKEKRLVIEVENPQDPERPSSDSEGIGLSNVRRRLQTIFRSEGQLECVESKSVYRAIITMPAKSLEEMPYNGSHSDENLVAENQTNEQGDGHA
jgi:LytS/YehU family sensor histidine kinase